jgi:hypothetical protein
MGYGGSQRGENAPKSKGHDNEQEENESGTSCRCSKLGRRPGTAQTIRHAEMETPTGLGRERTAEEHLKGAETCSLWLHVLIVENPPRETPETPRTISGGVWCIRITPAAQKVVTDAFNGFLALPVAQKSAMQHRWWSRRRIRGQELAPSRLQSPTEDTDV